MAHLGIFKLHKAVTLTRITHHLGDVTKRNKGAHEGFSSAIVVEPRDEERALRSQHVLLLCLGHKLFMLLPVHNHITR